MADTDQLPVRLTLYTRRGCHLCEDMSALLQEFSADYTYIIDSVDIDSDAVLRERFHLLVPALYRGDDEICHHFLDLSRLQAALQPQTA